MTARERLDHYMRVVNRYDELTDLREKNSDIWVRLRSKAHRKLRDAQDEVEVEEAREADEAARTTKPSMVRESDGSIVAAVIVHVEEDRRSHFDCPNCGKRVNVRNAYPFTWQWKTCPGCRLMWVNSHWGGSIGLHADKAVGLSRVLEVFSHGHPADGQKGTIRALRRLARGRPRARQGTAGGRPVAGRAARRSFRVRDR
jgi:hypothetical protein